MESPPSKTIGQSDVALGPSNGVIAAGITVATTEQNLNNSSALCQTAEDGSSQGPAADTYATLQSLMSTVPQDSNKIEIKLFVGRVPRHYEEEQLRPEFETFGQVLEVAVLKDKATQNHKGSAFVRMASITDADAAIRTLNNVKALDASLGAMQVRYATGEAEKFGFSIDNGAPGQDMVKLFVGSLPRNITDETVSAIFTPFGKIDEVFLLKDAATGLNKGCAFVKFCYKENAIRAIRHLNGQMTIPGGPRPVEVRVAESKKVVPPVGGAMPFSGGMGGRPSMPGAVSTIPGMGLMGLQMQAAATGQQGSNVGAAAVAASNANPRQGGTWREYFTPDGRPYYHNTVTSVTQWERPAEFDAQKTGGDATGPPGANIFVFHIPNDWGQGDLIQNFSHFGNIVSARIATDKATNRNKGYAFVSYDNIQSSVNAVMHMNGFMACGKRLKVSIKQNEDKYVAHIFPQAAMATSGAPAMQQQMQQQQVGSMQGMQASLMPGTSMFPSGQPQVPGASMAMLSQNPMLAQQPQITGQNQMGQQQAFNAAFGSFPTGTSQRYAPY